MPANLEISTERPQDWKMSIFIPIPKKGNAKEFLNYCMLALISHACKVMLKILQASLQQYMNWELSVVQAGFRKDRGTRDQIANTCRIIQKVREYQKIYISVILAMPKSLTVWITANCGKFLEIEIPDNPTCLLRNLCAGQEATVRSGHGTMD